MHGKNPSKHKTVIWVFGSDPVLFRLVELESSALKPVTTSFIAYSDLKTKMKILFNVPDTLKTHNS